MSESADPSTEPDTVVDLTTPPLTEEEKKKEETPQTEIETKAFPSDTLDDTMTTTTISSTKASSLSLSSSSSLSSPSKTAASSSSSPPTSYLATTLTQARRDLWSAQPIRPLRWILSPLRLYIWDPSLAIYSILLPPFIMPVSTKLDSFLGSCVLYITIPILHFLYPNKVTNNGRRNNSTTAAAMTTDDGVAQKEFQATAKNTLLHQTPPIWLGPTTTGSSCGNAAGELRRPDSDMQSAFQGAVSFVVSTIGDIVGAMANPRKLHGWMQAMAQLNGYLESSGVAAELQESLIKPFCYGRLFTNMKILNDIQEMHFAENRVNICQILQQISTINRDGEFECGENVENNTAIAKEPKEELPREDEDSKSKSASATVGAAAATNPLVKEGKRLMRFATAAYGTEMIRSALDRDDVGIEELETLQKAIAVHTNVQEDDVKLIFATDQQADMTDRHVLHHFVAVDHASKSIVLALRGTLSLSGAIVDVQGMAVDYCSGKAHQGIAEMAENVWEQSGEFVLKLLEEPDYAEYNLLITGHSLGAGTACLLTIKLHDQEIVPKPHEVICYAFAPPPTYCVPDVADTTAAAEDTATAIANLPPKISKAIQNTIAYIHDNDVVPFLSIPSVRRLAALLDTVDNETEHLWFWKRWKIFYEYECVPDNIIQSVLNACNIKQRAIDGASDLIIPSRMVLWCKKDLSTDSFYVVECDPQKVAQGNIFLCEDMLTDHLPEQYENALDALVEAAEAM